jgi:hypothetical protein
MVMVMAAETAMVMEMAMVIATLMASMPTLTMAR